ncbi:MAG: hypothetical protein GX610_22965 [Rhodococcus sp.]|nr:hypothetical protein [Rhodococcus sp. (in: high G+C Gram-positive bacteria)]
MTRHDRTGEPSDEPTPRPHDPDCRAGWLGQDLDGRPIPCLQCRPHLARTAHVNDHGANR